MRRYYDIQRQRDELQRENKAAYDQCPCKASEIFTRNVCNEVHRSAYEKYMKIFALCVSAGLGYYEGEQDLNQSIAN